MDQLTSDLQGVAVYLDDLLVSGTNAKEYLQNLDTLSRDGIQKVNAITKMPPPANVSALCSFLGSVQFYSKFIWNLSIQTEPLTHCLRPDPRKFEQQ